MEPEKWTFAEFWRMSQRRLRYDWTQTSAILSTIINMHKADGEPLEIDEDDFLKKLKELYEASYDNDEDRLLDLTAETVLTYKRNEE